MALEEHRNLEQAALEQARLSADLVRGDGLVLQGQRDVENGDIALGGRGPEGEAALTGDDAEGGGGEGAGGDEISA